MVDEEFESWGAMRISRSSVGMRAFLKRPNLTLNQRQGVTPPVTIRPIRPSQSSPGTSLAARMPTLLCDVGMAPEIFLVGNSLTNMPPRQPMSQPLTKKNDLTPN